MTRTIQDRLPSLDGIRAVSIALVLAGHAILTSTMFPASWKTGSLLIANANLGVRVFFVLSGLLITYLLCGEEQQTGTISLKRFYARRALRIVPVCYAFILVVAILDATTAVDVSRCGYLTAITYTKDLGCAQWIDGHLWSLSVEEQFYLLWPCALVFLGMRGRLVVAVALAGVSPVMRAWFHVHGQSDTSITSPFVNVDALMIGSVMGMLIARYRSLVVALVSRRVAAMRAGAVALAMCIPWIERSPLLLHLKLGYFTVTLGPTLQALCAAYLAASYMLIESGAGYRLLNYPLVRRIGVLSYSLYIWQQLFLAPAGTYGRGTQPATMLPLNLVLVVAAAWLSYTLLEKPLFSLRSRFRVSTSRSPADSRSTVELLEAGSVLA